MGNTKSKRRTTEPRHSKEGDVKTEEPSSSTSATISIVTQSLPEPNKNKEVNLKLKNN